MPIKISEMPEVVSPAGSAILPLVVAGENKHVTIDNLLATVSASGSPAYKDPVDVVATSNVTATGLARTIDGILCNDPTKRVLLTGQTSGAANGIYLPAAGFWTRAGDFDESSDAIPGCGGQILRGTLYAGGRWTLANTSAVILDTTTLDFRAERFVDLTGHDGKAITVVGSTATPSKITDTVIDNDTISPSKLASGGAGNNGLVVGVAAGLMTLIAPPSAGITPINEANTPLTQAASVKTQWLKQTSALGVATISPHDRMPRARARCVMTSNVATPLSINTSQDGLVGAFAIKKCDVVWYQAQTTPSENGLYRCVSVSGSTATMAKLALVDAIIAETGLYVQIDAGTSNGGTVRKLTVNGSAANSYLLPLISPTWWSFTRIAIEDFVLNADNTTAAAGNWYPVVARALEAMFMFGGELVFGNQQTYRFTQRVDLWTQTALVGNHTPVFYSLLSPRLVFDGCAGFFAPASGGETWEAVTWAGIEPWPQLRGLNCTFINGTTDNHYGALFHSHCQVMHCNFRNVYGEGIKLDSTSGAGGANGAIFDHVTMYGIGLNAWHITGGDANNIGITNCRATNFAIREFEALEYEPITGLPSMTIPNPAMTLNVAMRGTLSPAVTLSGTRSFAAGVVPVILVEINSIAGGTALGAAFFRVSYDDGATWALAGAGGQVTAATVALDGIAAGCILNFPAGTYATSYTWRGSIFPGKDWGIYDESFLGISVFNTELSAFHNGGIYALNSLSTFLKMYTEAGTECDITGCTGMGGNMTVRTGGNATRVPIVKHDTANVCQLQIASVVSDTADYQLGGTSDGLDWVRGKTGDVTGYRWKWHTSGGNTGLLARGWGTANAAANEFWTQSTHALGAGMHGDQKGHFLGTGMRLHSWDGATLPATGVPLSGGSATNVDGPWPVKSFVFEAGTFPARLGNRVYTNSGSASYNLTWRAVAHSSPPAVALATGDSTLAVATAGLYRLAANTLAANSVKTLGTAGARDGDVMPFEIEAQATYTFTFRNGGAGGTGAQRDVVVPPGTAAKGSFQFNGTDWIGMAWVCL
jgi:hypothetical protein